MVLFVSLQPLSRLVQSLVHQRLAVGEVQRLTAEAVSDDVGGVCDDDEATLVKRLGFALDHGGLRGGQHGDDDVAQFPCVCAQSTDDGRTAVQLVADIVAHSLGLGGDNHDLLFVVEVVQQGTLHRHVKEKSHNRIGGLFPTGGEAREEGDQKLNQQHGDRDIEVGILFDDHRDDVGTARRSRAVEQDRSAARRQHDRKQHIQYDVAGHRLFDGKDVLHRPHKTREKEGAIDGLQTHLAPQHDDTDDEQQHVDGRDHHTQRVPLGDGRAQDDGDAADAARDEVVGGLEEIDARRRHDGAEVHHQERNDVLFRNFDFAK